MAEIYNTKYYILLILYKNDVCVCVQNFSSHLYQ